VSSVVAPSKHAAGTEREIKGVAPTGRHVSVDMAEIYRVKDGQFVSYWCQTDVAGMLRQLTDAPTLASAM
jgi:predicted ester cyclase